MALRTISVAAQRAVLTVTLTLVVLAGCASAGENRTGQTTRSTTATSSSSTTTTTASTTSSSSSSSSSTTAKKKRNFIAWILSLGAGSPPGPATAEFAAYEALRQQDCASALTLATTSGKVFSVTEAAAKACLAAGSGDQRLWREASRQRDDLRNADLNCLEVGVFGLLDRLVEAHDANPDLPFTFESGAGNGVPPCPSVSGLEPAKGKAGDDVTIRGDNLKFVKLVIVDFGNADRTCFEYDDDPTPSLTMPEPPAGVTSAEVIVAADPAQWEMGSSTFEYEPGVTTTGEPGASTTQATQTVGNAACPVDSP